MHEVYTRQMLYLGYTSDCVVQNTWYKDCLLHRDTGPAMLSNWIGTSAPLSATWFRHGYVHRDGAPAMLSFYNEGALRTRVWFQRGEYHREDGPAYCFYRRDGTPKRLQYFRNSEEITDHPLHVVPP